MPFWDTVYYLLCLLILFILTSHWIKTSQAESELMKIAVKELLQSNTLPVTQSTEDLQSSDV